MYIQLNQTDYDAIAELIAEQDDCIDGYVEYSEIAVEVPFSKSVVAKRDTDYYNGTGAWEVKSVDFSLGEVKCGDIELRYNHEKLEKTIEAWLRRV